VPATGLSPLDLILLAVLGLVRGSGITALGPGGVLATIALFALTGPDPGAGGRDRLTAAIY
jgi:hypothetical protein